MKTQITVRSRYAESGQKTILAIVRGDWALHMQLDGLDFTVTHIPTGFALVNHVESCQKARECLRECARSTVRWNGQGDMPEKFSNRFRAIYKKYYGY